MLQVKDISPYFAVHNLEDPVVPYQQAMNTKTYLDLVNVSNVLYAIPGAVHTPDPFTTEGRDNGILFDDMVGFVIRHMSGSACGIFDGDEFDASSRSGASIARAVGWGLVIAGIAGVSVGVQ
jgi:hypothetical protein